LNVPSYSDYKTALAQHFGRSALAYHHQATLQRYCAQVLLGQIPAQLPPGDLLEVGCGTGFLSQGLWQRFGDRPCCFTDLAPEMVALCQQQLSPRPGDPPPQFQVHDGETLDPPAQPYALIASSFALQWFEQPVATVERWLSWLVPGGCVALAFPSEESFPEWRRACQRADLPYTGNALPNLQQLLSPLVPLVQDCQFSSQWFSWVYPNPQAFFQHLKALGTSYRPGPPTLSPQQWRHLWRVWAEDCPGEVTVSYHGVFVLLRGGYSPTAGLKMR
jgi:malonyl-CoA O-methyltransferase